MTVDNESTSAGLPVLWREEVIYLSWIGLCKFEVNKEALP